MKPSSIIHDLNQLQEPVTINDLHEVAKLTLLAHLQTLRLLVDRSLAQKMLCVE